MKISLNEIELQFLAKNHPAKKSTDSLPEIEMSYFKHRMAHLFESCSTHGLSHMFRSENKVLKIIWTILFVGSVIYSVYMVILSVVDYLQFKVRSEFESAPRYGQLKFPSVSVCNLNPFDFSNRTNLNSAYEFFNSIDQGDYYFTSGDDTSLCTNKSKEDQLISYVYLMSKISKYSMPLDKMMINCIYNDKKCDIKRDFTHTVSGYFGDCFVFNSFGHLDVQRAGMYYGLQLELFIGEEEYQPCWHSMRGVLVGIGDVHQKPTFSEEGLIIQPNSVTNLMVTKTEYNKLSSPYSDCVADKFSLDRTESANKSFFIRYTIQIDQAYSQRRCIFRCGELVNQEYNRAVCSKENDTSSDCLNNITKLTEFYDYCSEQCPIECEYSVYSTLPAQASYPSENYARWLIEQDWFREKFTKNVTLERVKNSILRINVYFSSMNVDVYTERPETDFNTFLANLGGQISLFLGVSLLSFFEILDFVFLLVEFLVYNLKRKNKA